jgi:hypothetical protein
MGPGEQIKGSDARMRRPRSGAAGRHDRLMMKWIVADFNSSLMDEHCR